MKFRYTVEKTNSNGVAETSTTELEKDSIRLGRGASADVLLDSPLISLTHAVIKTLEGKLIIEDLGSPSGVRVNNENVRQSPLKSGDVIKLGDIELQVTNDNGVWGILERRKEREESGQDALQARIRRLELSNALPSLTSLSLVIGTLTLAFFLVMPLAGFNKASWNSGPISNNHKMFESNCEACHSQPFSRVKDSDCKACHAVADHSPELQGVLSKHPAHDKRCAACHMEHNGSHVESLLPRHSSLCVECHGKLNQLRPETSDPNIQSLEDHPEFHVRVQTGDAANPLKKVRLDDKNALKDGTQIKLNHKIHLEPNIRGANGKVTMQCRDCHEFSADLKTIQPISFEKHCRSCHPLGFDERLPGNQVPHGKADEVVNYVFAEYAKLLLEIEKKEPDSNRLIPGSQIADVQQVNMAREEVQKRSRETEEMIFTKTGCQLCHFVKEEANIEEGRSRFEIVKPQIPVTWMPAARFDHGAHQQVTCESCHEGVRSSTLTTDVMLPRINLCRDCHAQHDVKDKVKSDCVECHSYHDALEFPDARRRTVKDVLLNSKPL